MSPPLFQGKTAAQTFIFKHCANIHIKYIHTYTHTQTSDSISILI